MIRQYFIDNTAVQEGRWHTRLVQSEIYMGPNFLTQPNPTHEF